MHRATSVYEPIPLDDFSSRHRHVAVHGGGEAHSLLASDGCLALAGILPGVLSGLEIDFQKSL